jgi:DNA-nicking Smr family endonuclease
MSRKPSDFELWLETAKTVKPLRDRASRNFPIPPVSLVVPAKTVSSISSAPYSRPPDALSESPPQITGLDRRTVQRLTRGHVEIERRLDLHGTGIEVARVRLMSFLRDSQSVGARNVLVITGKGESPYSRHTLHGADHFHAPERAGRLRKMVTEWFHEPEFRRLVAGFQPAHPKHGGGGAYYVRIRRIREEQ